MYISNMKPVYIYLMAYVQLIFYVVWNSGQEKLTIEIHIPCYEAIPNSINYLSFVSKR